MDEAMKRTDAPPVKLRNNKQHPAHRLVRSRQEPLSEEVCKTHRYDNKMVLWFLKILIVDYYRHWKQINETRDIYGQEVRIVHSSEFKQFAFVYECINQGESCTGELCSVFIRLLITNHFKIWIRNQNAAFVDLWDAAWMGTNVARQIREQRDRPAWTSVGLRCRPSPLRLSGLSTVQSLVHTQIGRLCCYCVYL